jgi:TonB family protein
MKAVFAATLLLLVLTVAGFGQEPSKKLTRSEALNAATTKAQPEYPPMARQLKIEGAVELEAVVSETGSVEKVNVVSGNPLLTKAATDALKKWKFAPATADGKAVKALAPVSFNFKM